MIKAITTYTRGDFIIVLLKHKPSMCQRSVSYLEAEKLYSEHVSPTRELFYSYSYTKTKQTNQKTTHNGYNSNENQQLIELLILSFLPRLQEIYLILFRLGFMKVGKPEKGPTALAMN